MNSETSIYNLDYFKKDFFNTDYFAIAKIIADTYQPKTIVEFGCGSGKLSKELAKLGIQVTAVDGFAQPDFYGLNVIFYPCDLNDSTAIEKLFCGKQFDLAVCLEVAEHLEPQISSVLIDWLTTVASIVVFSAAVPKQAGDGHINLRPREYWHSEFTQHSFLLADRLREKLRANPNVAVWYRFNTLDYIHCNHPQAPKIEEVIHRLVASESAATTAYFDESAKLNVELFKVIAANVKLNYTPVKVYLILRNFIKHIVKKLILKGDSLRASTSIKGITDETIS
jgi:cyclopropane fatty-acyl-phospholipid synthase-like methyltransferase